MSNIKDLPKGLPKINPFFTIENVKGNLSGQLYSGSFECKIPNLRIQGQIDKYYRFLNGGMDATLDRQTLNLHKMTAYCKFCLTQCDSWFSDSDYGLDLYDINVLEAIYDKIIEKEEEWLKGIWGDPKEESSNE